MPMTLDGGCRCGAVRFTCDSHTPQPYQRCYCSICRKTAGGGGYAINLGADARTLRVEAEDGAKQVFHAEIRGDDGAALWLFSPEWPELVHPFASAIDGALPVPPSSVHLMLRFKPSWVTPQLGAGDACFELYPDESIEDWHRKRMLWVD